MSEKVRLSTPLTDDVIETLSAGDSVLISGILYTARDAAHKRLFQLVKEDKELPFDLQGSIIYYVGPTPPRPGQAIGSAGPTSSYRMDLFTPALLERGLKGMIGKGARSQELKDALQTHKAVYFVATGGAGALIAQTIKKSEVIAYEDLGTEAVRRLEVEAFPVLVAYDVRGNDLLEQGRKRYRLDEL